jgi:hypothetical protein
VAQQEQAPGVGRYQRAQRIMRMERVFVRISVCSEMVYIKDGEPKGKTVQIDKRFCSADQRR